MTSGTLGTTASLRVEGAPPNMVHVVAVSLNGGPTPISILDPIDPRSLEVGTELFSDWIFNFTSPTGTVNFGIGVPNAPVFQGLVAHWQTFTFPGSPTIIDRISNDVLMQLGAAGTSGVLPTATLRGGQRVDFTLFWLETATWDGRDHAVRVLG